jgi:AAA ATPase domain/AAA domain
MFEITLHNFRSFHEPGPAQIKPLTVIVGENSTGKSSFLAILRIALEMVSGDLQPNFNRDPFFLGAYDQIAHYRGGRGGRSPSFSFALTTDVDTHRARNLPGMQELPSSFRATYFAEFTKSVSQPLLSEIRITCGEFEVGLHRLNTPTPWIDLSVPSRKGELSEGISGVLRDLRADYFDLGMIFSVILRAILTGETSSEKMPEAARKEIELFRRMWGLAAMRFAPFPVAMAPVRTKPERTYNPIEDRPTSEGSHVPMVLAKTYFTDRPRWTALQGSLNRFGKSSGLFEQVSLKALGRSSSDPFQIMVKMAGPRSNLIDVGYGVSQVLPIIVDLITSDPPRTYLLQQPEVHLHPRGQAELATFLGSIVKETGNYIVIETHSDYIIDRLRSDIRKKKHISADLVSILFLERVGIETIVYQMRIDEDGNLKNAPATYRDFTMEEERRLLGIDEDDLAAESA